MCFVLEDGFDYGMDGIVFADLAYFGF